MHVGQRLENSNRFIIAKQRSIYLSNCLGHMYCSESSLGVQMGSVTVYFMAV